MQDALLHARFDRLVESGLVQFDEKQTTIEYVDGDLKFQFLLSAALVNKPTLQTSSGTPAAVQDFDRLARPGSDINTAGYELGDIGKTHFLAANKFCFARPHLMLLTSDGSRKQYEPLDMHDIAAAWHLLQTLEGDHLIFFNCGKDSGCSRVHKHMQIMPKPTRSFASFLDHDEETEPEVPFQWFFHRFETRLATTESLTGMYGDLLDQAVQAVRSQINETNEAHEAVCAHNFILTKQWMLMIPRHRANINKEAGVNAMGMIGVIAVATQGEIHNWVSLGLKDSLRGLGVPLTTNGTKF